MAASLAPLIDALVRDGGEPPAVLSDPYAIVLHENAGYLIPDERRDDVYARLTALAPTPVALLGAGQAELRALARYGVVAAGLAYAKGYREACAALAAAFGASADLLQRAYLALRRHGKALCRNARPECPRCPVAKTCPSKRG